ncbi:ABC transporter ATP-binding protein [Brevibacterium yomogidense]
MLRRVFTIHDRLIPHESKGWLAWAALGSFLIAMMDMVGVAMTLPLMLVATSAPGSERVFSALQAIGLRSTGTMIVALAVAVGAVFILKSVIALAVRWWQLGRQNRLEGLAAVGLLELYSASPYDVHRARDNADVQRQINFSLGQVFNGVLGGYLTLSVDGLTIVLTVVVLSVVSPVGMLTAAIVFGSCIVGVQLFTRDRARRTGIQLSDQNLVAWSSLLPLIEGFREVRLTGSRGAFLTRYREARMESARAGRNLAVITELPKYALEISLILGIGSIAAVVTAFGNPAQTVAVLGVFAAAAGRITPTLNRLAFTFVQIKSASVSVDVLEQALQTLPTQDAITHATPTDDGSGMSGDITLENVGYRYPDSEEWQVRNISFTVPYGSSVAIAGSSGAGKSTLLDLVLGLFTPREGVISANGANIHSAQDEWMRSIGVVSQDVYLLNNTVARNVTFGVPDEEVDIERLHRAISDAQLNDLIDELPQGIDTQIGERGVRVSGGQKQRLGIARALYRQPKVLILDEATSALDNKTEHQITKTIEALSGALTIIIVAHRLSTIRNVDNVIYMSSGSIAAQGTFEEVTAANAEFAELVELGRLT